MSGDSAPAAMTSVKLALLAQQLREQQDAAGVLAAEPIAIVGVGCRFPAGADTPERFWDLMRSGVDAVREVPADRWDIDAYFDPDVSAPGRMNSRWGAFVDDVDLFDAGYFGISPREASRMDPQQRLVLEVAVEAFERAGQPADRLAGSRTGVFIASTMLDYGDRQYDRPEEIDAYSITGNRHCFIANRLSFLLDLHGPSVAVDTACSSSLVAVHSACQSLRARECDLALAGGVNAILSPEPNVAMSRWGVMAPDGRCKTFDASADGFVRGEGCGAVVLKRLADALSASDPILAVVRGSAVNQDGRSTAMSAPNGLAQQDVIRRALRSGRVPADAIGFVETHGTGTELGDPIEVEALAEVLGKPSGQAVALGAVKTNIGHLEAAAGIAGLIKLVLCLQHGEIPANLHFSALNPHIDLEGTRLVLPSEVLPWAQGDVARVGGVSSFGFGGTNAHVVVEEAPRLPAVPPASGPYLLAVSAQTGDALHVAARRLADHLSAATDADTASICATASLRRTHHDQRAAVVGATRADLVSRLRLLAGGERQPGIVEGRREPGDRRRIAFVFSGQGTQWWGMGRELLATSDTFREVVERCDALLSEHVDWSLLDELTAPEDRSRLDQTAYAQPALFALQVGVATALGEYGVVPDAVAGHSVGEVAAAHLCGALSLEDAIAVIANRGRFMQDATGNGTMASVALAPDALEALVEPYGDRISIAALNAPDATVISGETSAMDELVAAIRAEGVEVRPLPVDYAFHSAQMAPHADALGAAVRTLVPTPGRIRFVSTVTGGVLDGTALDAGYWARNVREPVRFAAAVDALSDGGCDLFVEIGPQPVLGGAIARTLREGDRRGAAMATLRRGRDEVEALLATVGALHCHGVPLDWTLLYPGRFRVEPLPTYPWQRRRYWVDAAPAAPGRRSPAAGGAHPLLGARIGVAAIEGAVYESTLSATAPAFLGDHRVGDLAVVPAMAFVELAVAAFEDATGRGAARLTGVELQGALALDDEPTIVQVHVHGDPDLAEVTIASSRDGDSWTVHATGQVSATPCEPAPAERERETAGPETGLEGGQLYEQMAARGVRFGESFRAVERVWRDGEEAVGELLRPAVLDDDWQSYRFHPALLDAALHPLATLLTEGVAFLPLAIGEVRLHRPPEAHMRSRGRVHGEDGDTIVGAEVTVEGEDGSVLAELLGLRLVHTDVEAVATMARRAGSLGAPDDLYELQWISSQPAETAPLAGPFVIVADDGGFGAELERTLTDLGAGCTVVPPELELTDESVAAVLAGEQAAVVYLRALDIAPLVAGADVVADQRRAVSGALAFARALPGSDTALWLVTRGSQAIGGAPRAAQQATMWGLGASILAEHPDATCVRVDLDPDAPDAGSADALARSLGAQDAEDAVALRGEARLVERLAPLAAVDRSEAGPTRLASERRGVLDELHLEPLQRRAPGPGEIEIRVAVTGLNFRDVLIALDLYPEHSPTFGDECAGEVVAVGPGVEHLRPGDRVMSMGSGAFATHLTTDARLAIRIPDDLAFEDAATIPIPFLTAHYALVRLGRLAPGERVLIHAAAGGVGMAAVQLAQAIGAEVFATAGNPDKRATLVELGVEHVFDSRSLDFADGVREATDGRGVDVVLNSLADDFIPRSLDVLAPQGRFLEIGKRDIWDADRVAAVRPDVDYSIVFLGDLSIGEPAAIQAMLSELMSRFEARSLHPLPRTVFDVAEVVDAFRFMAQARHTGKIVVRQRVDGTAPIVADGTYLVTGGLGGIGLQVAHRLVQRGVRHLALVGRGEIGDEAAEQVAAMADAGAQVVTLRADVSVRDDVARLLDEIADTMPPLRGVVHAAGVNDDALLAEQTWESFRHALVPKLAGGWHLFDLTRDVPLTMFVSFSSASSVVGGPAQANYAAANAFLDSLGALRQAETGVGLSIGWGPWDRVGMTARIAPADLERMARRGIRPLPAPRALDAFEDAVAASAAVGVTHLLALDLDRSALEDRSVLRDLRGASPQRAPEELLRRWVETVPGRRRAAIAGFVTDQARKVLGLPADATIPPRQPFNELGLDSLMAVELRNALGAALGRPQPATLLFDHPTTDSLVDHLLEVVEASAGGSDASTAAADGDDGDDEIDRNGVDAVAALTEEEAEALLLAELDAETTP